MTIPVPKRQPVSSLHDYRPVALSCIVMKILEQFVLSHLKSQLPQYAYMYLKNHCIEDAAAIALHNVLQFLDKKTTNYVSVLSI